MNDIVNYQELHKPVLVNEVVAGFNLPLAPLNTQDHSKIKRKPKFLDLTLGVGGHAVEIIKRGGYVYGIDADVNMLEIARKNLKSACPADNPNDCSTLIHTNFRNLDRLTANFGLKNVDGVLFDLGISSVHLTNKLRGFSFEATDASLDMRLDPTLQVVKASMLVNALPKRQLIDLFSVVLRRDFAIKLSAKIIQARVKKPLETVGDFVDVVNSFDSRLNSQQNRNNATLPFLALRIAVNSELENLSDTLPKALATLRSGGRMLVISFHSGEDKIVKNFFKTEQAKKAGRIVSKKPIVPSEAELTTNPRARSAKLRIFEKA